MDVKKSSCGAAIAAELPWKTRLVVHLGSFALDACRLSHPILRFVRNLEPKSPPSSKAINGVSSSDITVDPSSNLWFRLYLPSSSSSSSTTTLLPLLIYFHGGGFLSSAANSKTYDLFCRNLAAHLQVTVASVNYRLAPNHRYPSQYNDGFETLKFIDAHNYAVLPSNIDLNRCFLAGDSAGGNIAHHVAVRYGRHEFEKLNIIGLVEIQPFFGGEERSESELRLNRAPFLNVKRTDWMWRSFLPIGSDRNHEAVSGGDVSEAVKFPATLVVVGGGDPLQDWQRRYVEGLKKSGKEVKLIEYPNAIHGFYIFPVLPQLWSLIVEVGDFIQSQSARNA
ncbi:putative carboxylesterase 18 [Camellia lanceoleosa]|uniref:Carboxylesterase 18 n=1 Tax=Camellia lanceoleosa TaxID=1840588 RepID=A0ACC0IAM9_9ERIC|nr:putative carboxylesterase 18 [Camellia lanceoleosa]